MNYFDIIIALEGSEHFNPGMTLLNALPRSGQLTFMHRGDMIGWVLSVSRRTRVDHEVLMVAMAHMVNEGMLEVHDLGLNGLFMVGIPATF